MKGCGSNMDKKHIILIDDSIYKMDNTEHSLAKIFPNAMFHRFDCSNKGISFIFEHKQDMLDNPDDWLVATDMQMPALEDGGINCKEGAKVLRWLKRYTDGNVDAIIVSSDKQDDLFFEKSYGEHYLGSIKYDSSVYMLPKYQKLF